MIKLFAVLFLISTKVMGGDLSINEDENNERALLLQEINRSEQNMSQSEFLSKYDPKEIYKKTGKIYLTPWEHEQHDSALRDGKNIYPPSALKRVGLKYKSGTNILVEDIDPLPPKTLKEIWQDNHFKGLAVLTIGGNIVFNLMLKNLVYFMTDKLLKKPTTRQSVEEYNKFRSRI